MTIQLENQFGGNKLYRVHLSEFDLPGYTVVADNEQDALDTCIDYAEANGLNGLFLDIDPDWTAEEYAEETADRFFGGNHGRYLSSENVSIVYIGPAPK